MDISLLFIQSSVDGHLDFFYLLAIVKNTALDMGVQMRLHFKQAPRDAIAAGSQTYPSSHGLVAKGLGSGFTSS